MHRNARMNQLLDQFRRIGFIRISYNNRLADPFLADIINDRFRRRHNRNIQNLRSDHIVIRDDDAGELIHFVVVLLEILHDRLRDIPCRNHKQRLVPADGHARFQRLLEQKPRGIADHQVKQHRQTHADARKALVCLRQKAKGNRHHADDDVLPSHRQKLLIIPPLEDAMKRFEKHDPKQLRKFNDDANMAVYIRLIKVQLSPSEQIGEYKRDLQADHVQHDKIQMLHPSVGFFAIHIPIVLYTAILGAFFFLSCRLFFDMKAALVGVKCF